MLHSSLKYKYNFPLQDVNVVPASITLVEELCDIISELFPDLWKLGQAYFSGELHVKFEAGRQTEFRVTTFSFLTAVHYVSFVTAYGTNYNGNLL